MSGKVFQGNWWSISIHEQWSEWFSNSYNWKNFCFIELSYEDECHLGNKEVVVSLLGLYCRIGWVYDEHAAGREIINERFADFKAHPDIFISLDEAAEQRKKAMAEKSEQTGE